MRLDVEDLETQNSRGTLVDLLTHEIGHIIGIGTLWDNKGFLQNPSLEQGVGVDTHFNGPAAIREFDFIGGESYTGAKVPVENTQGGGGTRDSHWRESYFTEELMTGFIDRFNNPLSRVTIGSLEDLGYVVDLEGGDDFNLAPALRGPEGERIHLVNDILWLPLRRAPITNPVNRR